MPKRRFLHQSFLSSADIITPSAVRTWVSARSYNVQINSCHHQIILHNDIREADEIIFKLRNLKKACDESIKAIQQDKHKRKMLAEMSAARKKAKNTEGV
jgi:hypothetical protein